MSCPRHWKNMPFSHTICPMVMDSIVPWVALAAFAEKSKKKRRKKNKRRFPFKATDPLRHWEKTPLAAHVCKCFACCVCVYVCEWMNEWVSEWCRHYTCMPWHFYGTLSQRWVMPNEHTHKQRREEVKCVLSGSVNMRGRQGDRGRALLERMLNQESKN